MYSISIQNLQENLCVDLELIRQRLQSALETQDVARADLSVALVTDAAIHVVNREHLAHDYPTDVISFLYEEEQLKQSVSLRRGSGKSLDGELVVSTETAIREANLYGWQPIDELTLYLVHGFLHLCGYDDLTQDEQLIMREEERRILQLWNLTPHYRETLVE